MLKKPVMIEIQGRERGVVGFDDRARIVPLSKFDGGTARPENPARLALLSKVNRGTAIQDLQERNFVVDEHKISQLFTGYFNNKMTLLIFLIQARSVKPNPGLTETVVRFLDELFRHMLEPRYQKQYRLPFKWLKRFFQRLPDVSVYQRDRARYFIRAIYDAFGLHLKTDI